MNDYRYILQPYKSPADKHHCPSCGRRSFKFYIDANNAAVLDPTCGRCDHEQSCGYHLTPRDFFAANPDRKPNGSSLRPLQADSIRRTNHQSSITNHQSSSSLQGGPRGALPASLVTRSISPASSFCQWLRETLNDDARFQSVCHLYHLGATRDGAVIFWQIDRNQRVRTGKVMHYTSDGHRTGNPNWIHALLRQQNQLPTDFQLSQCLFGEHLLTTSPSPSGEGERGGEACLVEAEKTAILCAALYPEYTWLATGGCKGLTPEKLLPLAGRHVIVYPDSGCYADWEQRLRSFGRTIDYTIVDDMEQYPPNTDLADLIIAERNLAAMRALNPELINLEKALNLQLQIQ